jgi:phosphoglycolate phosphatase
MVETSKISAVLIDLDGTLMDTVPDLALAANRLREEFGLPSLPVQRIAAFVGKGASRLIHRVLRDDMEGSVDEASFSTARESFYRYYHEVNGTETVVYDRVPEGLQILRKADLRLACVTNKPREFTVPLLKRLGLARWFLVVAAGDDVKDPKPNPALLQNACTRLGIAPWAAWMIGDSLNDVMAAKAAGIRVVLVETGYNEDEPIQSLRDHPSVEAIVPSLYEAACLIVERFGLGAS